MTTTSDHKASAHAFARSVGTEVWARMRNTKRRQTDLAELLDLSQAAVSRRLNGEIAFDVIELRVVAQWLECSVRDLIASSEPASDEAVA